MIIAVRILWAAQAGSGSSEESPASRRELSLTSIFRPFIDSSGVRQLPHAFFLVLISSFAVLRTLAIGDIGAIIQVVIKEVMGIEKTYEL